MKHSDMDVNVLTEQFSMEQNREAEQNIGALLWHFNNISILTHGNRPGKRWSYTGYKPSAFYMFLYAACQLNECNVNVNVHRQSPVRQLESYFPSGCCELSTVLLHPERVSVRTACTGRWHSVFFSFAEFFSVSLFSLSIAPFLLQFLWREASLSIPGRRVLNRWWCHRSYVSAVADQR